MGNPNLTDDHGAGPLLVAVQEGHLTIVRDLIEHEDFTADGEISKTDINASREDGITPVFTAAWLGRIHVLRLLLEFGADPNPSNNTEFDDTPLCGAINRGHSDAVRALIAAKAIVNASPRKSDGMTPFTLAVSKCNEEDSADARTVLELLIEAGANAEGTSSGAAKSGAKAMPARRAAPSMSRKASQAEFKSMKIAKDRAKERTVVAKEEMVLAKIEVENAAKQNETKTANHTEVQQKQRELRVTASIHALNKAKDNVDEHQEREAAAEAALLEQDIERHEEEEKETKKRAKEAKDKAEKEVKAAQEKAQQAKEQVARAEAAHDKAEASAQAEAKRLADVAAALEAKAMEQAKAAAAVAAAAAEKEAKEAQEAKEAEERAIEARRVQAMKEQKEKEEKERREAEEAKVRAIHIALHATLKTSYYATKKTELFKKIMNG